MTAFKNWSKQELTLQQVNATSQQYLHKDLCKVVKLSTAVRLRVAVHTYCKKCWFCSDSLFLAAGDGGAALCHSDVGWL